MADDSASAVSGANSYFALYSARLAAQAAAQTDVRPREPLTLAAAGPSIGSFTPSASVTPVGSFRPAAPLSSVTWDTINAYVIQATLTALRTPAGGASGGRGGVDPAQGGAGSLRINQNLAALNAYRHLLETDEQLAKSLEKLSSGYRINRAADDAAGLAISEGLRSQVGGLKVAVRNAQDGISVVQTAEGGLTETHAILHRMRDLAVRAGSDSADPTARQAVQAELAGLKLELDRIASTTAYNNIKLLDGGYSRKDVQVGYAAHDTINVDIASAGAVAVFTAASTVGSDDTLTFTQNGVATTTDPLAASATATLVAWALNDDAYFSAKYVAEADGTSLVVRARDGSTGLITGQQNGTGVLVQDLASSRVGIGFSAADLAVAGADLSTRSGATAALTALDDAIDLVATARANLGALRNRFEHTIHSLEVSVENLSASESRIRTADVAREMLLYTRSQILSQAGTAMLAQANQAPQGVLALLQPEPSARSAASR